MPNNESQHGLSAACKDAIRVEQQKHQHDLSTLRVEYEAKLRAVSERLGELKRECGPCAKRPAVSRLPEGNGLVQKRVSPRFVPDALRVFALM